MAINILELNNLDTLKFLDWDYITEEISSCAYFEITMQRLKSPPRTGSHKEIKKSLDAISYLIETEVDIITQASLHFKNIPFQKEMFSLLNQISKAKIFNIKELNFLANLFVSYGEFKRAYKNTPLTQYWEDEESFNKEVRRNFINPFRTFVDPNGDVHYEKHPALSKIFNEIIKIEKTIRERIRTISQSPLYKEALQYTEHDTINDHFVLAIRSDSYNSKQGPIVSRSSSGLTLFVSPPELSEKNSKRLQLMAELEEIISKICSSFSQIIHPFGASFNQLSERLLRTDQYLAKAQYSLKKKLFRPHISDDKKLKLESYFHPLIKDPVTNHLSIPEDKNGLLISGPNTGGKTVTLKSIAIIHLFLHMGMYVPAYQSEIYPFKKIFYFSHDQQDLKSGLSSFASEAKNYLQLIREIKGDESLILIDEIFNSTSSEEASALAISLLEEINELSDSMVFISTHHQFLKAYVHKMGNLLSSHVGFNLLTHAPTYKINIGTPGGSMAFDIFDNLCLSFNISSPIGKRAKEILQSDKINYEELLNEVIEKTSSLDDLILRNKNKEKELLEKEKQQQGLWALEKEKILIQFQNKIDKVLEKAQNLTKEAKEGVLGKKGVQRKVSQITHEARNIEEKPVQDLRNFKQAEKIGEGQILYSMFFKRNVEVISIRKDKIYVRLGNKSLWCDRSSLSLPRNIKQAPAKINISRITTDRLEYDCRGMRLDEFRDLVESSLVSVESGEIPYALFVHGHGDGVLKEYIRKRFKDRKDISCGPYEGNDGCTKIEMIT